MIKTFKNRIGRGGFANKNIVNNNNKKVRGGRSINTQL